MKINMKNSKYTLRTFVSMVVLVTGVFSCAEEFTEPESLSGTSITDVVKASTDFDILEAALIKTGLATSFDNTNSGSYTVFAPSDVAFLAYLAAVYTTPTLTEAQAVLNIQNLTNTSTPLSISQLSARLNYHIVSSKITTDMITGANGFNTLNGARLSLSKQGATILLNANTNSVTAAGNGATVTLTDGTPVNGIIHVIDRFLVPVATANLLTSIGITAVSYATNPATITPSLTALETVGTTPNPNGTYNILAYAIVRANLATVLQPNASPLPDFTLFAPTDDAFRAHLGDVAAATPALENAAIATLKAMDPVALADLLKYHIISGRVLSTDLTDEQVVNTLLTGKSFTINIDVAVYTLKDNRDADALNDPTITTANTLTNAGVRHTVNTVLRSVPD